MHLFRAFAPMLCKRPTKRIEESVKEMGGSQFIIEEKLDGERIQLHKRGNEYFYCSRFVLQPPGNTQVLKMVLQERQGLYLLVRQAYRLRQPDALHRRRVRLEGRGVSHLYHVLVHSVYSQCIQNHPGR